MGQKKRIAGKKNKWKKKQNRRSPINNFLSSAQQRNHRIMKYLMKYEIIIFM